MGVESEFQGVNENSDQQNRAEFEGTIYHAREAVIAELPKATSLAEFMMLTDTLRDLDPEVLGSWVDRESWSNGPEEWIKEFSKENDRLQYEKEVEYATALRWQIGVGKSSSSVQVAVMKVEEEQGSFRPKFTFRGVAVFPNGQRIADYGMPRVMPIVSPQDEVYIKFSAVCNEQAAEMIIGGESSATFEIENLQLPDIYDRLGLDISEGIKQNFKYRDAAGNTVGTRDPKLYILFAVKGGFSNEDNRYLISDFIPPSGNTDVGSSLSN